MRRAKTSTIITAMRILSRDIQSGDGVANAAILEAAERIEELVSLLREASGPASYGHWSGRFRERVGRAIR